MLSYLLVQEVGVMVSALESAGFEVVVASVSGKSIEGTKTTLSADFKLAEVDVSEYDGLIMPCMAVEAEVIPEAAQVVKLAVTAGIPVAAQFGSVHILAEAGALKGKKYAIYEEPEEERFAGATYAGNGIVKDGNIITSGICPFAAREENLTDGTPELTQALIKEMTT
jgi:putative intracellular protease/amidase